MRATSRGLGACRGLPTRIVLTLCLVALPVGAARGQAGRTPQAAEVGPARGPVGRAGTTLQLPEFGVAIDAEGIVSRRAFEDPQGRLAAERAAAARAALPADVLRQSRLRKISLVGLDAALRRRAAAGAGPDPIERHLAGLTRLEFAFLYPDRGDIVIAGEAGGWREDAMGRAVALQSGRPVILLEDLCVALRAFWPGARGPQTMGCSIDPSPEALERLLQFQRTVPKVVADHERPAVAARMHEGLQTALGEANVRVFGVSAATHLARVLVEADYRMKLIAIDLEPPPVPLRTFLGGLQSAPPNTLQRWWFRPDEHCLRVAEDRRACELLGRSVRLSTEDLAIGPDGRLVDRGGKAGAAAQAFAGAFTAKYPQIADTSPVFAQLRNGIDLLVLAAFMRREGWQTAIAWDAAGLRDERTVATETLPPPRRMPCAVNVVWKGRVLLAPAGGVSIAADELIAADRVSVAPAGVLEDRRATLGPRPAGERWWWD
jgi:hypothetical protein